MSSELLHNLSYAVNLRGSTVFSEDVTRAVNKSLNEFYVEALYQDYLSFYKQHRSLFRTEENLSVMQSEKTILCEINSGLWAKAIKSAISSLTQQSYPHYIIVQEFINYLLNADTDENFGLLENFFWQLLLFHPPCLKMFDYYSQIMFNHFVVLSDTTAEEQNLFVCLMEACSNSLNIMVNSNGNNECNADEMDESDETNSERLEHERFLAIKNLNSIENESSKGKINSPKIYFRDLRWNARLKRCLIALNFVYNILEADFVFWLSSKDWKPFLTSGDGRKESRPLLSQILWPDARDIGILNKEVHRVLDLYELLTKSALSHRCKNIIEKFLILVGEVFRCSDSVEEIKYPFVGIKSENFFRQLSIILHQVLVKLCRSKKFPGEDKPLVNLRPSWLRLFLCSHILSSVTGTQCLPELTTAVNISLPEVCHAKKMYLIVRLWFQHDILLHIAHDERKSRDEAKAADNPGEVTNSRLLRKLKNLKSVNAKLGNGKTHLHLACEANDLDKIRALLSFPDLDVNATDREGWTALHRAAYKGNVASVKELLLFSPKCQDLQKCVNTRARGPQSITPIMCAVPKNHTHICTMLLEHSGPILLEDTNELNETALEMATNPELRKTLEKYRDRNVSSFHSHMDLSLDSEMKQLVLRLCVEMIQAYFCTHRTWDVYRTLKQFKADPSRADLTASDLECSWDYMRYHRDIKRNIYKLRKLVPNLEKVEEFKGLYDVYVRLLTFNKVC